MSNPKNAIQEIKNLMVKFGFMSNDNQLQSFKTSDDVIFQVEKLEVGKSINKIKVDRKGLKAHHDRISNGLILFGKYYRSLWD